MSLIELRSSLLATLSVYKTTSAMRILSMSLHTYAKKLAEKQLAFLTTYDEIFNSTTEQNDQKTFCNRTLFIFIGTQRGMCGSHNVLVAEEARKILLHNNDNPVIVIGKKLSDILGTLPFSSLSLPGITKENLASLARTIQTYGEQMGYAKFVIVSMHAPTLLSRTVKSVAIDAKHSYTIKSSFFCGHCRHDSIRLAFEKLSNSLRLNHALTKAFLAEQASRFIAMDASAKNAEESLHEKKILYNKIRKNRITRAIQDLSGYWYHS